MRVLTADVDRKFTCVGCRAEHALPALDELGDTAEARAEHAQDYSRQHGIDLASAYSALLGLMPTERGLPTHGPKAEDSRRSARYDRGFISSVQGGFLTPRQAVERGDRVLYASRISQLHGLSMNHAFLVADNRLQLRDALRANAEKRQRSPDATTTGDNGSRAYAGAFAALVGGATLVAVIGLWTTLLLSDQQVQFGNNDTPAAARPDPESSAPTLTVSTEVRLGPDNDPAEIRGQNPRAVLEAFCNLRPGRTLHGLKPAADGRWTGSYQEAGRIESIVIRTAADGALWSAVPAESPD